MRAALGLRRLIEPYAPDKIGEMSRFCIVVERLCRLRALSFLEYRGYNDTVQLCSVAILHEGIRAHTLIPSSI
jgi:hypothetical protein